MHGRIHHALCLLCVPKKILMMNSETTPDKAENNMTVMIIWNNSFPTGKTNPSDG